MSDQYDAARERLLGDRETPFSLAGAQDVLGALIEAMPRNKVRTLIEEFNELGVVLSSARSLIELSKEA